ncbi:MAG: 3-isopropylmalate dehydratase small subunit [Actinomycetota bacterium]
MILEGNAWKYGRDINTDLIIPAKYLVTWDPNELSKYCLEGLDVDFAKKVKTGDILVAEENFGCGSSREHAPIAIKGAGISLIIAKSFARIFFRNAINMGLPILESEEAVDGIKAGDRIRVDLEKGEIKNLTTGKVFHAHPFPDFMRELLQKGGLINYVRERLK